MDAFEKGRVLQLGGQDFEKVAVRGRWRWALASDAAPCTIADGPGSQAARGGQDRPPCHNGAVEEGGAIRSVLDQGVP